MRPEDEREALWKALHTVDDRVTALEATMRTRNELLKESIYEAVKASMPAAMLSDEERIWLQEEIKKKSQSIAFRRKIIESAAIWAIPLIILAILTVFREYVIAHGMWTPAK